MGQPRARGDAASAALAALDEAAAADAAAHRDAGTRMALQSVLRLAQRQPAPIP